MKIPCAFHKRLACLERVAADMRTEIENSRDTAAAELLTRILELVSREEREVIWAWLRHLEEAGRNSFTWQELEPYDRSVYAKVEIAVERLDSEMRSEGKLVPEAISRNTRSGV